MQASTDIPWEEDLLCFLQTNGAAWKNVSFLPWSTAVEGQTFIAFSSSENEALGRPFDPNTQGGAAEMLNSMRKTHFPVLLSVQDYEQDFLFFHPKKSK